MGKPYKQPQKREVMAGSKLEIEMLQYSLNEANQKLAKGYYVKKAHDTIPLDTPIAGCTGIVVEVTLGTPKDDHHFTDLCDDCRLKFLKMAVEHLERKVAAEKEGLNNDGEETDV